MNSWAVSACYPRRTFCPLSDGPSIQNHRITRSCFRTCSPCQARSQARLCPCTSCAVSDRAKRTFELLRYSLGGDRPSQTAYHARSPRSEEHTSELQSPYVISYAVFCLKKKN